MSELARTGRVVLLALAGAVLGIAMPAAAKKVVQNETTQCLAEFAGLPGHEDGGTVQCTDCDPTCDVDQQTTANGSCTFNVQICLNQAGGPCTAGDLKRFKVTKSGNCNIGAIKPTPAGSASVCGKTVPVKVALRGRKNKPGKCIITIAAKSADNPPRVDVNKLTLVCNPQPGTCPAPTTTTTMPESTTTSSSSSTTETTVPTTSTTESTTSSTSSSTTTSSTESTTSSTTVTTTTETTTPTTVATTSSTTASTTTSTTETTVPTTTSTTATTTSSTTETTVPTTTSTSATTTTSTTATTTSSTTETTATTTSSTTETTSTTSSTTTSTTETTSSTTSSTTATTTSSTTTTTVQLCCGFPGAGPTRLSFTTGIGAGNCGTIQNNAGTVTRNLQCGGLFTGGGSNTVPLPYAVPDQGTSLTGVSACNSGTGNLTLTNLTSGQTGSIRNCTSVGCFFGPPLPIPNSVSTPTSVCVVNSVATNASGTMNCASGDSNLNLPLTSTLFLDGDLLPNRPGIQVCPICTDHACVGDAAHDGIACTGNADCGAGACAIANTCHGGPNDGLSCTPSDSAVNAGFPTTHDCPPPDLNNIGGLPIAFNLFTTSIHQTAQALSGQTQVFCGFCRDINAAGTGCFRGDPDPNCPHNATCTGAAAPWNCCTGVGTGSCDPVGPQACTSGATCMALDGGTWPDCQQRNNGAFGPAGGGAHTINETGTVAGNMTDGLGHASTLVSIFCIQPTFNATVDAAGDLPGPGAVSLPGTAQLLP